MDKTQRQFFDLSVELVADGLRDNILKLATNPENLKVVPTIVLQGWALAFSVPKSIFDLDHAENLIALQYKLKSYPPLENAEAQRVLNYLLTGINRLISGSEDFEHNTKRLNREAQRLARNIYKANKAVAEFTKEAERLSEQVETIKSQRYERQSGRTKKTRDPKNLESLRGWGKLRD